MENNKIIAQTDFASLIHNAEICGEIVKWGNANNYPLQKAKLITKLDAYVGFAPEYMIVARRKPPVPGGWSVTVEKYEPETRVIPVNVKTVKKQDGSTSYAINKFVIKMMEEYRKEGLTITVSENPSEIYGSMTREITATGHPILVESFEEFIDNMR
ncbi:MAG: hypothetical protein WC127_00330 [Acidaminococcaceae bacterium]